MICPLKLLTFVNDFNISPNINQENKSFRCSCEGGNCAWWVGATKRCSVTEIAMAMPEEENPWIIRGK